MSEKILSTDEKALAVNLDDSKYGTFAEIGAGQEVVRHFFQAGATAGTVAKSISAYDMKFSDEIYGKADRYVSRGRLVQMLEHEYALLEERLTQARGERSTFFAFANTVAAQSFRGGRECHGWMGMRFQLHPGGAPCDIILHVRMLDRYNLQQQDALGIFGVNLVHGAFFHRDDPRQFIRALADNLGKERIEVDMIQFLGSGFEDVDNRILSLILVQEGMTNAVVFDADGSVRQPAEVLYKKAVLMERGSFHPVNNVHLDMLECARQRFAQEEVADAEELLVLFELNLSTFGSEGEIDLGDFLARVDALTALGQTVLISNYFEFYRLSAYFRRYTTGPVGIVLGISNLANIFNEDYYEHLEGGILESLGRLFKQSVKLYVYPMTVESFANYQKDRGLEAPAALDCESQNGVEVITAKTFQPDKHLQTLYDYLKQNGFLKPLAGFDPGCLGIFSREIVCKIRDGDESWTCEVPAEVASMIKSRKLWGCKG